MMFAAVAAIIDITVGERSIHDGTIHVHEIGNL